MRLLVATDETSIVAIADLAPFLEAGTFAVRLDAVSRVLAAIRVAANAVTPADNAKREADPARMELLAQVIVGVADAVRALAKAAPPDDPNAQLLLATLSELHL